MARSMNRRPSALRALRRLGGAAGVAAALAIPCGVTLTADPAPTPVGRALARIRARVRPAAPPPAVVVEEAAAPAPPPAPPLPDHPLDLARALPEPAAAERLAAMLEEPEEAAAAAEALATTPEGRPLLVAHLARPVEAPGLDHLAALEALSQIGREEDLAVVLAWAHGPDAVAAVAAWCARAICERERIEEPDGLPPEQEAGAEPSRGDPAEAAPAAEDPSALPPPDDPAEPEAYLDPAPDEDSLPPAETP
ncbi:MAG: hypothetical protein M9894_04100 [Planctomycetes bacterium]|nr:hypothetical protein [Planctomycetota bacterium]